MVFLVDTFITAHYSYQFFIQKMKFPRVFSEQKDCGKKLVLYYFITFKKHSNNMNLQI